ncbi:MAG: hypothetical protein WCD79_18470, partial [Chthoniobacteraceae bacterium]
MKNFLILLLILVSFILFWSLKVKTRQLDERDAMVADLTNQLEAAKQGHEADAAKMKAMEQTVVRVAPVAPVAPVATPPPAALVAPPVTPAPAQTPGATVLPAQARETALGEFAKVMKTDITTSAPPFVIFMDEAAAKRDADAPGAEEERFPGLDTVRRMGIDRYNGFMTHLFPGRPDLRMVPHTPGGPEEATSGLFKLSPAKLLWVAVDDASPDAKYAVRWLKVNSPQLKVTQDAMLALDQQIGGSAAQGADAGGVALVRCLHDAQESLKTMLNGRPPV